MDHEPQRILILGAGSPWVWQGVDVAEEAGYEVVAVVDNLGDSIERLREDIPLWRLTDLPENLRPLPAICCVATPDYRKRVISEAVAAGIRRFATVIHPRALVSRMAKLGSGCFVSALGNVGAHAQVGNHVFIRRLTIVAHNCIVDDYASVGVGAIVGGGVRIASGVNIGMGARILPDLRIGENAMVAAGAVVTKDVPPNTLVAGIPAVVKREDINGGQA